MTEAEWLGAATVPEMSHNSDNAILQYRMLEFLNDEGLKDVVRVQALRKRIEALGDSHRIQLNFLDDCGVNERKLRLYGCACCRSIWRALADERCRRGVEVVERLADGLAMEDEREQAVDGVRCARGFNGQDYDPWQSAFHGPKAVLEILELLPSWGAIAIAADQATIALYYEHLRRRGVDINRQVHDEEIDWNEENAIRAREVCVQLKLLLDIFGNPFRPVTLVDRFRTPAVVGLAREMYDDRSFVRMPELADLLAAGGCDDESILAHCRGDGPHARGCWVVDLVLGLS
jgi:hypothetical protein